MQVYRPQPASWVALVMLAIAEPSDAQFYCVTNRGALTVIGYRGPGGTISVPGSMNGLPVVAIDDRAFYPTDRAAITNLLIPESITNIGGQVIGSCPRLIAVSVEPRNPSYSALDGVLLNKQQDELLDYPRGRPGNYIIPGTVISVRSNAFRAPAATVPLLTGITIPEGVTSVGDYAFASCINLTNATIADSITNLGIFAFSSCTKLPSVTIPGSVGTISGAAFDHCTALTDITIMHGVREVATVAFRDCYSLARLTLPDSITDIGECAFESCTSLTGIRIGTNVLSLSNAAFRSCTQLASITLPNSLTNIGDGAFSWCGNLQSVYCLGNAPDYVWAWVGPFEGCPVATIFYLPDTTGWGAAYAGRPTALWLPRADTDPACFGIHKNEFGFTITWASGMTTVVEACSSVGNPNWFPVSTNTISTDGSAQFSDPNWTNDPVRFYRVRWP